MQFDIDEGFSSSGEVTRDSSYRRENIERLREVCFSSNLKLLKLILESGTLTIDLGDRKYGGLCPDITQKINNITQNRVLIRLESIIDDIINVSIIDPVADCVLFVYDMNYRDLPTLIDFSENMIFNKE